MILTHSRYIFIVVSLGILPGSVFTIGWRVIARSIEAVIAAISSGHKPDFLEKSGL